MKKKQPVFQLGFQLDIQLESELVFQLDIQLESELVFQLDIFNGVEKGKF